MPSPNVTYSFSNSTTADATQVNQNFTDLINGMSDGTKDFSISALTCAGNVTLNGNTTIGNASSDDLTVTASLASTISIKTTNSYDFGSSTKGLQYAYFGSSAGSNTTRLAGGAVTADAQIVLPSVSGTLALNMPVRTETSNYTAASTDGVILCNANGGAFTVTLPASASNARRIYVIKKMDSSTNAVTIDGNSSETIDGATTTTLNTIYEAITIYCDGSNWHIVERRIPENWTDHGTITWSTGAANGSATRNKYYSRRVGKFLEVHYQYYHTASGTAGSGDYRVLIPATVDTAIVGGYTGTLSTGNEGGAQNSFIGSGHFASNGGARGEMNAFLYDDNEFRCVMEQKFSSYAGWSSSNFSLGNSEMAFSLTIRVPISGWNG